MDDITDDEPMESSIPQQFSVPTATEATCTSNQSKQFCQQITLDQYNREGTECTRQAVRELMISEEYKMHSQKCHSCSASWYNGRWTESCEECGGYAINRPCPICKGKCGTIWIRDVDMSHSHHSAFWDGECALDEAEKSIYYFRTFVDLTDESALCDAIDDVAI